MPPWEIAMKTPVRWFLREQMYSTAKALQQVDEQLKSYNNRGTSKLSAEERKRLNELRKLHRELSKELE